MRKQVISILLTAGLILGLAGCAATPENNSSRKESGSNTTKESGSNNTVDLVIWQHEATDQRIEAFQAVIDRFMKANPGITVTQEVVQWDDDQMKMLSAISSGETPDMNVTKDTNWQAAYQAGGLYPMDEIVEAVDEKETIYDVSLKSFKADGKYWALPFQKISHVLMYRPSMFEAAGIEEAPKTWSELLECAEKLTVDKNGDGQPEVYGAGITTGRVSLTTDMFASFLVKSGGDIFDQDGKVDFDTEETKETLEFYKELAQYSPEASSSWSWGELENNWAAGKLAMINYASPNLSKFFESEDFDIASVAMPVPDGLENQETDTLVTNLAILCFKDAMEKEGHYEATKKFLEFCMEPENNWLLTVAMEPAFFLPVTETGAELVQSGYFEEEYFPLKNFDFAEGSESRDVYEQFAKTALDNTKKGYALGNKYGAVNSNLAEIYNSLIISDMVQKAVLEDVPVDEAVDWAQSEMEKLSN